ncbi:hypothetical protein [Paraburkholderia sartisoli]|uniref:Cell wall anchor protein n=1 Tax=Paraburkholderia sartisoli TaxID=83784 RepID=A0A1H3ZHW2_9BURK|nr:hypothetical protein [Paraburkholderia sartisoli]SEA22884.1 hypothetical protein SAMN05192564_101734 [Paraburkholderia sartisoli]
MKRTIIAAAVFAAATGSAFASPQNPYLFNATMVGEQVGIQGWVTLFGCVDVSSTAGAVVNNNQSTNVYASLDPQAQSYIKGAVTTTYNNRSTSVVGTGTNSTYNNRSFTANEAASHGYTTTTTNASNSTTTKSSSSNYAYGNTASAAEASQAHSANDSGWASNSASASDRSTTHTDASASNHANSSYSNGSHGQAAAGTATAGISTSSGGNIFNGHASVTVSGSESTASNYNKNHNDGSASTASHGSNSHDTSNSTGSADANHASYADASQSWAATASNSGSGNRSHGSTSTYAHNDSSTHTSGSASASSYSNSSQASHQWGYSVNDTLATTDVTTTGHVTQVYDTRVAGTLNATTGAGAGSGVSGNLGINIAEGIDNAQSNDTSLASVDIGNVFGNAQIFSKQSSSGRAKINNFNLNASIGDNSLQNVSGNVGVNVASGIGNAQNNSLAGAVTTAPGYAATTAMVATDDNAQNATMSVRGQFQGTAMLGAGALAGSTGNIGVNIAGGAGNLQHNGLAIAALNSGH